jgi:hypothetical protein
MLQENYSKKAMLIECMIYGTAGMITTRELITMAAWHMLEDETLKQRFIEGDEDDQFAIIEEILRLEPVAGSRWRECSTARSAAPRESRRAGGPDPIGRFTASTFEPPISMKTSLARAPTRSIRTGPSA